MAITTPTTTAQFGKAIDPAVRKFFVDEYGQVDPKIEKILRVGDQIDFNQQEQTMFGMGQMAVVGEAENYPVGTPLQGYTTTYTPVKLGEVITISWEMQKYDKSGIAKVEELTRMQARQVAASVGTRGSSLFRNGFSTSYTSYGDGKPLFSTDHTRADGGTAQSNASANGITLTEANLETAIIAFRQQLTDRGLPTDYVPDKLLVPLNLTKEALIITKSDKRSGTADNDANVYSMAEYKGGKLDVMEWRYLDSQLGGSDTAWFLLDSRNHKVSWKWGLRPEIGERNDSVGFNNDTVQFKVRYQGSIGWSDYRGTWGSKGDGAAYSS